MFAFRVFVLAAALLLGVVIPADASSISTPGYQGTTRAPATKGAAARPTPQTVSGAAFNPAVLVDAAGSAHLAWNERGALRYCRVPRGGRCTAPQRFPREAADPRRPVLLAFGDQLLILRQDAPGAPVLAWLSTDGGTHFEPEAVIGGPLRNARGEAPPGQDDATLDSATTFGPPSQERIALGFGAMKSTLVQTVRPGAAAGPMTVLAQTGGSVSVAASGSGLLAAYDAPDAIVVRAWRDGDPADPASWSSTSVPQSGREFSPLLAGGPSGGWLQTQTPFGLGGSTSRIRRLGADGAPGAPTDPFRELVQDAPAPVVDAAGVLHVAAVSGYLEKGKGRYGDVLSRTIGAAGRAGALETLKRGKRLVPGAQGFASNLAIGVAGDGGGFAAYLQNKTGGYDLKLLGTGPQGPTGKLGLGGLAAAVTGGSPVTQTCTRLAFGAVNVAGQGGCLLGAVRDPKVKVAEGTIRLNGLEIVPRSGVKILMDARDRTIDTTGDVLVQLRKDTLTVPLFEGELHLKLPAGDPPPTTAAPGCTGVNLFSFGASKSKPELKGFPIEGQISAFLRADSVCLPIVLKLPKAFGGIRANAVLIADNKDGLHLDSLAIGAPTIPIGPVLIKDLGVTYNGGADTWTGKATVTFPPGWTLGATVTFKGGAFNGASVTASPAPFPGTPLFSGVFLNRVTGGFTTDPLSLTVGARVGALPIKAPDSYAITVDGSATATFGDPFTLQVHGDGALFGIGVASLDILLTSDLYFSAAANVSLDFSVASIHGAMKAYVDGPKGTFAGQIDAGLRVFGYDIARAQAVLSSIGVAACASVDLELASVEIGAGYKWGDTFPDTMWGSCDLGDYLPPTGSRGFRAGGPATFAVASGTPLVSLRLAGDGGAPDVVLVSPAGERITPQRTAGGRALLGTDPASGASYIALPKPAPGTWTIEPAAASPALADVRVARPLPAVKVSAAVGGSGRLRTLRYTLGELRGRTVRFLEVTPRGERAIGTAKGATGTLRFAAAPGPGGPRVVVAVVEQDGTPRRRLEVARYVAPPPARPATVRRVIARRVRGGLHVRWLGGTGADTFLVRIDAADGRRLVLTAKGRALRVPGIPARMPVRVSVRGRTASGTLGRARTVSVRTARR